MYTVCLLVEGVEQSITLEYVEKVRSHQKRS